MFTTRTLRCCTLTIRKTTCCTDSGQCSVRAACRLFVYHANSVQLDTLTSKATCSTPSGQCSVRAARRLCVYHANPSLLHTHSRQNNVLYGQRTMLCQSQIVGYLSTMRDLCCCTHSPTAKQLASQPTDDALREHRFGCLSTTHTLRSCTLINSKAA